MREPGLPFDANCAVHPAAPAVAICSRCGSFACSGCARSAGGLWFCASCLTGHDVLIPADRGARFLANLVDQLLIFVPAVLAGGVGFAVLFGSTAVPDASLLSQRWLQILALAVLLCFGALGAEIWAQVYWGQSLGKRALQIKVVRSNGAEVELWRIILLRNLLVVVLTQVLGIFGLIDVLFIFGKEQRCLHDYMSDTIVVQHTRPS
jgi:uncharacterized RDD family membrane protein YckC